MGNIGYSAAKQPFNSSMPSTHVKKSAPRPSQDDNHHSPNVNTNSNNSVTNSQRSASGSMMSSQHQHNNVESEPAQDVTSRETQMVESQQTTLHQLGFHNQPRSTPANSNNGAAVALKSSMSRIGNKEVEVLNLCSSEEEEDEDEDNVNINNEEQQQPNSRGMDPPGQSSWRSTTTNSRSVRESHASMNAEKSPLKPSSSQPRKSSASTSTSMGMSSERQGKLASFPLKPSSSRPRNSSASTRSASMGMSTEKQGKPAVAAAARTTTAPSSSSSTTTRKYRPLPNGGVSKTRNRWIRPLKKNEKNEEQQSINNDLPAWARPAPAPVPSQQPHQQPKPSESVHSQMGEENNQPWDTTMPIHHYNHYQEQQQFSYKYPKPLPLDRRHSSSGPPREVQFSNRRKSDPPPPGGGGDAVPPRPSSPSQVSTSSSLTKQTMTRGYNLDDVVNPSKNNNNFHWKRPRQEGDTPARDNRSLLPDWAREREEEPPKEPLHRIEDGPFLDKGGGSMERSMENDDKPAWAKRWTPPRNRPVGLDDKNDLEKDVPKRWTPPHNRTAVGQDDAEQGKDQLPTWAKGAETRSYASVNPSRNGKPSDRSRDTTSKPSVRSRDTSKLLDKGNESDDKPAWAKGWTKGNKTPEKPDWAKGNETPEKSNAAASMSQPIGAKPMPIPETIDLCDSSDNDEAVGGEPEAMQSGDREGTINKESTSTNTQAGQETRRETTPMEMVSDTRKKQESIRIGSYERNVALFHSLGNSDSKCRLYVGNLPFEVTWRDLKDHIKKSGSVIIRADVLANSNGSSKGFGIVEFATAEGATHALRMNRTNLMGREILVRKDDKGGSVGYFTQQQEFVTRESFSNGEEKLSCLVFVENLSWDVTWQDLQDHMWKAGKVTFAQVMCVSDSRYKGRGIVEYSTPEEAKKACIILTKTELKGSKMYVREDRENYGVGTGEGDLRHGGSEGRKQKVGNIEIDKIRGSGEEVANRYSRIENKDLMGSFQNELIGGEKDVVNNDSGPNSIVEKPRAERRKRQRKDITALKSSNTNSLATVEDSMRSNKACHDISEEGANESGFPKSTPETTRDLTEENSRNRKEVRQEKLAINVMSQNEEVKGTSKLTFNGENDESQRIEETTIPHSDEDRSLIQNGSISNSLNKESETGIDCSEISKGLASSSNEGEASNKSTTHECTSTVNALDDFQQILEVSGFRHVYENINRKRKLKFSHDKRKKQNTNGPAKKKISKPNIANEASKTKSNEKSLNPKKNTFPSKKYSTYIVDIPITNKSLFINIKGSYVKDEVAYGGIFAGYRRLPDGSKGIAQKKNLISNFGDIIVSINGINIERKSFSDIHNLLTDLCYRSRSDLTFKLRTIADAKNEKSNFFSGNDRVDMKKGSNSSTSSSKVMTIPLNATPESSPDDNMIKSNEPTMSALFGFDWSSDCQATKANNKDLTEDDSDEKEANEPTPQNDEAFEDGIEVKDVEPSRVEQLTKETSQVGGAVASHVHPSIPTMNESNSEMSIDDSSDDELDKIRSVTTKRSKNTPLKNDITSFSLNHNETNDVIISETLEKPTSKLLLSQSKDNLDEQSRLQSDFSFSTRYEVAPIEGMSASTEKKSVNVTTFEEGTKCGSADSSTSLPTVDEEIVNPTENEVVPLDGMSASTEKKSVNVATFEEGSKCGSADSNSTDLPIVDEEIVNLIENEVVPLEGMSASTEKKSVNVITPEEETKGRSADSTSTDLPIVDEGTVNPTLDICWSCELLLERKSQGVDATPFYFTHSHPLLSVSTCSACADAAFAVEDDIQSTIAEHNNDGNDNEGDEIAICSLCALDESQLNCNLLLCDKCPRTFCERCVALSHGGGSEGEDITSKLVLNDDDWHCMVCKSMGFLSKMQDHLRKKADGEEQVDDTSKTAVTDSSTLTIDDLIQILTVAEDSMMEADGMLEEESLLSKRLEIRNEIANGKDKIDNDESINNDVEDELNLWIKEWKKESARNADTIGITQDLLEGRGVDLRGFYKERSKCMGVEDGRSSNDNGPEWKAKADASLDARDEELGFKRGEAKGASGWDGNGCDYKDIDELTKDELEGIEEINTTQGAIAILTEIAERKKNKSLVANFKEKALPADDKDLASLKVVLDDKQWINDEDDVSLDDQIEAKNYSNRKKSRKASLQKVVTRNFELLKAKSQKLKKKRKDRSRGTKNHSRGATQNEMKKKKRRISTQLLRTTKETSEHVDIGGPREETSKEIPNYFQSSDFVLDSDNNRKNTKITVAKPIANVLKDHQKKGIHFLWNTVCTDLKFTADKTALESKEIQGGVLAHNMGLGKSLQVIALVHTLLKHPLLVRDKSRIISRVLLVVPVNTLANWGMEFDHWVNDKKIGEIQLCDLNAVAKDNREFYVKSWYNKGGVLLVSFDSYARISKMYGNSDDNIFRSALVSPGPDLVVLDEAHLMLKNKKSEISKALSALQTKRRIALTGTPLQNNLTEYYRMADWIKPGCLGSETSFESKFSNPIMDSLVADSSEGQQKKGQELLKEIFETISSSIHRLDSSILEKDLPPMQQAVIHVRQSKVQISLYRAFNKHQESTGNKNFLDHYSQLFPVNNHPATLLMRPPVSNKNNVQEGAEDEGENNFKRDNDNKWWERTKEKYPKFSHITSGNKIVLLLQILAHADLIGEKVVVFSQSLRTLDFIESVLSLPDWSKKIPSISRLSPGRIWGGWSKNVDYLRIDGSISAAERGDLVTHFHLKDLEKTAKLFLLSSRAGGVGINLIAANRVILFDSSWNPATDLQALYRCYRYGQTKPVYAYRFLTEGTMEEKVYSRSVEKSNLAARVIDQKDPRRNFTADELANVLQFDTWTQCDKCNKWRMLLPEPNTDRELPDKWYCHMNVSDMARSNCDAPEEDKTFYLNLLNDRKIRSLHLDATGDAGSTDASQPNAQKIVNDVSTQAHVKPHHDKDKAEFTKRDVILNRLLGSPELVKNASKEVRIPKKSQFASKPPQKVVEDTPKRDKTSAASIISRYNFHDALLKENS